MDDSMEIEGSGMNVRVWGNLVNHTYTGIASTVVRYSKYADKQ